MSAQAPTAGEDACPRCVKVMGCRHHRPAPAVTTHVDGVRKVLMNERWDGQTNPRNRSALVAVRQIQLTAARLSLDQLGAQAVPVERAVPTARFRQ